MIEKRLDPRNEDLRENNFRKRNGLAEDTSMRVVAELIQLYHFQAPLPGCVGYMLSA
jgi:hypothetical protein